MNGPVSRYNANKMKVNSRRSIPEGGSLGLQKLCSWGKIHNMTLT